uniref:Macaca fascicularis brain cDNA clone: QflA-21625, similar to human sorting nexin 3 (SNX3), transcript variant 2, mRNA, RefSeq: NM_152827.1 n=1 Tax=Macaca fascicularis TaxID=9541 RepID=I7G722_MACFA|nr:unnamed protein product [Macaca fascicularis]
MCRSTTPLVSSTAHIRYILVCRKYLPSGL